MRAYMYTLKQDEKHHIGGVIYYCTATFDDSIQPSSIEVACRHSMRAAVELCIKQADVMRKERVARYIPHYRVHANGLVSYTPNSSQLMGYPQFTVLGRSVEETRVNTTLVVNQVWLGTDEIENYLFSLGFTKSRKYMNEFGKLVIPPPSPPKWSFWNWFK